MSRLRNSTHLRPEDAADPVHVAETAAAGAEDVRGSVLHHQAGEDEQEAREDRQEQAQDDGQHVQHLPGHRHGQVKTTSPHHFVVLQYNILFFIDITVHPLVAVDIAITDCSVFYGIQSCPIPVVKGSLNWELMRIRIFCADELHLACTLLRKRSELIFIFATAATLL